MQSSIAPPKTKIEKKELKEILLNCPCPPDCTCGNKNNKQWYHTSCKTKVYMNNEGDLYCEKYQQNKTNCLKFFIQHAQFFCSNSTAGKKYRNMSDFVMALSQALKAVEMNMKDYNIQKFINQLNVKVAERWVYEDDDEGNL